MRIAAARPIPISFMSTIGISAKTPKTSTMTTAALVTTPAVDLIPLRDRVLGVERPRS